LFGEDFIDNPSVEEALTQEDDTNRALAIIGDSVLNLVINNLAYRKSYCPACINWIRERLAEKKTNQKLLNKDKEFTKYLVDNEHTKSPVGGIGLEKADRFYEALIGAMYVQKGFKVAENFVCDLLRTNEEILDEFSDLLRKSYHCPICNADYVWKDWVRRPVFEVFNDSDDDVWFDYWELICPKGHTIQIKSI